MNDKLRSVNTRFWDDTFISELSPNEKLLFLYLITNPLTNLLGIYEITIKRISFDTGLKIDTIRKGLERFKKDKRVYFVDGFIILSNFLKNQRLNANMKIGITKIFNQLPNKLRDSILMNDSKGLLNDYQTIWNVMLKYEIEIEDEIEVEKETESELEKKKEILEPSLHSVLKEIFLEFYNKGGEYNYYWKAKDGKAMQGIIAQLRSNCEEDKIPDAFRVLLEKNNDKWINDNLSVSIINSKFNEIVRKIKGSPDAEIEEFERKYYEQHR